MVCVDVLYAVLNVHAAVLCSGWLQLNCFTSGSCVFWVLNFDNVAPSEELHARLRGYIINLLNIRFMQLFTQPSMAVTWGRDPFIFYRVIRRFLCLLLITGPCVTVVLNFEQF